MPVLRAESTAALFRPHLRPAAPLFVAALIVRVTAELYESDASPALPPRFFAYAPHLDKLTERVYTFCMSDNDIKVEKLKEMLDESRHAVFFGGAGVSVPSGIPDFRSPDGLAGKKYPYPFEVILSHEFFFTHTEEFWNYCFNELDPSAAKPNAAHIALAELEKRGKLKAVVTQNIDGLHEAAGSRRVFELHGTAAKGHCVRCGKVYGADAMRARRPAPRCDCGGLIKPDIVLYGESLDESTVEGACEEIAESDLLIVGGTSLSVYPAAGFISLARGKKAFINKTPAPRGSVRFDLEITGDILLLSRLV